MNMACAKLKFVSSTERVECTALCMCRGECRGGEVATQKYPRTSNSGSSEPSIRGNPGQFFFFGKKKSIFFTVHLH